MQRLEVSGAVRPIYWSLGVKRLMIIWKKASPLPVEPALKTRTRWSLQDIIPK